MPIRTAWVKSGMGSSSTRGEVTLARKAGKGRYADKTTTLNTGVSGCQKAEFPLWDQLRLCLREESRSPTFHPSSLGGPGSPDLCT